jgi:hypothetical protein
MGRQDKKIMNKKEMDGYEHGDFVDFKLIDLVEIYTRTVVVDFFIIYYYAAAIRLFKD